MRIDGASRHRTTASGDIGVADAVARRRLRAGVLAVAVLLIGLASLAQLSPAAVEAASAKITICHRTHSTTNPYRKITVSQSSVQSAKHGGHGLPIGSGNPAVFDPTWSYASNDKYWGDVIPGGDAAGLPYNGTTQIALNWTTAGQAIFFGSHCAAMTPSDFYNAEIAAGQTQVDILADMNTQFANEDVALLAAIGGSFTAANLSSWNTAVTVTTNAVTLLTATSARLNGSLTVGLTSTVPDFLYGTSPTLAFSDTTAATPSPVTNTAAVIATVTGLTPATTYYFELTGTTNAGTDTEGILFGAIVSFTTPALTAQNITFGQPADMTTGDGAQAIAVSASSGLPVAVTSEDTAICTIGVGTVTPVAPGTCSLTATQAGDTTYAAAAPITRTFVITDATTTTTTTPSTTTTAPTTTTIAPTTTSTTPPTTTTTIAPTTTSTTAPTSTTTTTPVPPTATSTTTPTTTTVTSPVTTLRPAPTTTAPDVATGSVHGVVWFDRNGNGVVDPDEWPMPGVSVTLDQPGGGERPESLRLRAAAPRRTAITTADGSYSFGAVDAGSYRVTAAVTIKGFEYTSDTDGATDWYVAVNVAADAGSTADFAGLGHGAIIGRVFDSTTLQGVAAATVSCRWSGYDDVLYNDDDLMFTLIADAAGSFDLVGIPFGFFTCDARDSISERQSASVAATVLSAQAVNAPLPVGADRASLTVESFATLPNTGMDVSTPIVIAFLLVMIGAAMTFTGRARRASRG